MMIFVGFISMKISMMHTGHAFTRIMVILCVALDCYSQTCVHTYSPIVSKFVTFGYNGQYTYLDQFGGAERYQNANGRFLFKPNIESSYLFSDTVETGFVVKGMSLKPDGGNTEYVTSAASLGVNYRERRFSWETRLNGFNRNLISSVCTCDAGTTGDGAVCTNCLGGTYKILPGSSSCLDCPAFSDSPRGSTSLDSCQCNSGYFGANGSTCTSCPLNSNSPAGSTEVPACTCNAGWTGNNGNMCTNCLAGTYKTSPGNSICLDCPEFSDSPSGSTALASCQCKSGYIGTNGSTCTSCPQDSDSSAGNTTVASCTCNAGSYRVQNQGSTIVRCCQFGNRVLSNGFKCTLCDLFTGNIDCVCIDGFTGNGVECTKCPINTFKLGEGPGICIPICLSGEFLVDNKCMSCVSNTSEKTISNLECLLCTPGKYSLFPKGLHTQFGSNLTSGCYDCPSGTFNEKSTFEDIKACKPCNRGTFNEFIGSSSCQDCPAGKSHTSLGVSNKFVCKECRC